MALSDVQGYGSRYHATIMSGSWAIYKSLIPVSPNLLYTCLITVAMGPHGLQIEWQAAEIRRNLTKLDSSFADFLCAWDTLGTHLPNAYTRYDDGQKRLDRFGLQLTQIQADGSEQT